MRRRSCSIKQLSRSGWRRTRSWTPAGKATTTEDGIRGREREWEVLQERLSEVEAKRHADDPRLIGMAASPWLFFGLLAFITFSIWLFPEVKNEDRR